MKAILIIPEKERVYADLNGHTFDVVDITTDDIVLKGIDPSRPAITGTFHLSEVIIVDLEKEYHYLKALSKNKKVNGVKRGLAKLDLKKLKRYCIINQIKTKY